MNLLILGPSLLVVACLAGGVWSSKNGKLANRNIKVVAATWKPFLQENCPYEKQATVCSNGEDRIYNGIMWDLLMFMKQAKNLSYTMMGIDDAYWSGTCYDSDNCTGMIGRVNRHEADIALGLYIFKSGLLFIIQIY